MPANLTPDYLAAEQAFKDAVTPQARLEALRHMLSVIPKHKGTEKMQADLKRRISKLQDEMQRAPKAGHRTQIDHVPREGAGQVAILGGPNSGKSSLLAALTHAKPDVAPYPFTTQHPIPGMMAFEDIQVQLVDTPALAPDMTPAWLSNTIRNADGAILLVNLGDADVAGEAETALAEIRGGKVELASEEAPDERVGWMRKPAVIVGSQADLPGAAARLRDLEAWAAGRLPLLAVSAATGEGIPGIRSALFRLLRVVRVYSKMPQKPPDLTRPFVVRQGATVVDVARLIHKDIAEGMTYAKIWGAGKYDGQRVQRDHHVHDKDVLELHLK